jgi:hypothetical protein
MSPNVVPAVEWASSVGFDVVKRYEALRQFYKQMEHGDEAAWTDCRLEKILHRDGR